MTGAETGSTVGWAEVLAVVVAEVELASLVLESVNAERPDSMGTAEATAAARGVPGRWSERPYPLQT